MLKSTLQNSSTITDPEEDQEGRNEGDVEGGYAKKDHLKIVLLLKALEGARWNSIYCNTIVQSHLMFLQFFGSEELSNLL